MVIGLIKLAALSATVAVPIAFAAGMWIADQERRPPLPVVKVFVDPRAPLHNEATDTIPQFDTGDPRFIIDPDGTDDQSRNRSCDPTNDDCDQGPDDPDLAVIKI